MSNQHFCTCKDLSCKLNPHNHQHGCDPCIKKCLKDSEIPSCFFRAISADISKVSDFTYEGFSAFVLAHKQEK